MTFACSIFKFSLPIDLASALIGGIIGLILIEVWDWIRRPKVKALGVVQVNINFGILYKLKFKIMGKQHPGICELKIEWDNKSVNAKWDEAPNPLQNDDMNNFRSELVPATFYQPLFLNKEYTIPIIHRDKNENLSIFSGWWFGRNAGYGPNPDITEGNKITLILSGNNLEWKKSFKVKDIVR